MHADMHPDARVLVINADDLGLTDGVTRGIMEAHRAGTVTSASLMVNTPGFPGALVAVRAAPALGVGLHLNLTVGHPMSPPAQVATLIDRVTGRLLPLRRLAWRAWCGQLRDADVRAEVTAQFARAIDAGVALTHVDGHQHVHWLPHIAPIVETVARRFGVQRVRRPLESLSHRPLRVRATAVKLALELAHLARRRPSSATSRVTWRGLSLQGDTNFEQRLHAEFRTLPLGVTELIVHPGYIDSVLRTLDDYLVPREVECAALTSPATVSLLRSMPLRQATFATL